MSSATRIANAARATAPLTNVDRRMMTGRHVGRMAGSALSTSTAVMEDFVSKLGINVGVEILTAQGEVS